MPRGRHGGGHHGHRARHRAHHHHHHDGHHGFGHHHHGIGHHHHGIGHHHHHGIGHGIGHGISHGIGHHHHHGIHHRHHGIHHRHHGIGHHPNEWHLRPRRHRHVGGWPFKFVLFQRRRPIAVAPAITTVTTTTGETVNVAQPVTATVTQDGAASQPTVVPQQPSGYPPYPPQPGQQAPYSSEPPAYYPADPYPPIDLKQPVANDGDPNSPAQPMAYDASGQPVQADPTQQQNEEFDECVCYCCCIL